MSGCYEVTFGNKTVGKVQVLQQGLYVRVICRCMIPGDQICKLYAVFDDKKENLGVLIPEGSGFLLDKRIPAKRLQKGDIRFVLSAGTQLPRSGEFIPIYPEEPFRYIDRLKTAFLETQHGKVGIWTQNHPETV